MRPCHRRSPHWPEHRFTSRSRRQVDGVWTDWEYSCCWCGMRRPEEAA